MNLLLSLIFCCPLLYGAELTPEQICGILPSCVQVELYSGTECQGGGSAICVYISEEVNQVNGRTTYAYGFVTAAHVLDGQMFQYGIRAFTYDAKGRRLSEKLYLDDKCNASFESVYDSGTDAGFFIVYTNEKLPVTMVPMRPESDTQNLMVGEPVYLLGAPLLTAPIICKGMVAQLGLRDCVFGDFGWEVDVISIDGDHGDSGGGFFDCSGNLIGFCSLGFSRDSHGFVIGMVNLEKTYRVLHKTRWRMILDEYFMPEEEVQKPVVEDPMMPEDEGEQPTDDDFAQPLPIYEV